MKLAFYSKRQISSQEMRPHELMPQDDLKQTHDKLQGTNTTAVKRFHCCQIIYRRDPVSDIILRRRYHVRQRRFQPCTCMGLVPVSLLDGPWYQKLRRSLITVIISRVLRLDDDYESWLPDHPEDNSAALNQLQYIGTTCNFPLISPYFMGISDLIYY